MIINYIISAVICVGVFVMAWIIVFMAADVFLSNQFDYYFMKAERAMAGKDFDKATYYNERVQTVANRMNRVERLLYFRIFP